MPLLLLDPGHVMIFLCITELRNFTFSVNYMFDITKYSYANTNMRAVNEVAD